MRGMLGKFVLLVIAAVVSLPVAVLTTLLCFPFWRWFEETTGIESYGHSGPADWCYLLTYCLLLLIAAVLILRPRWKPPLAGDDH